MTTELINQTETLPATLINRIAALRKQSEYAIELWQPEPFDSLVGVITGKKREVGVYGEGLQILITDETGKTTAAWLTPVTR